MKKTLTALLAATAIAALVPALASAAPGRGGAIDERIANISQRIDEGERGGGLTRNEVHRLRDQLHDIQNAEARDLRHGLNDSEQRDLNKRLDRLSADVDRQRHDRQHR